MRAAPLALALALTAAGVGAEPAPTAATDPRPLRLKLVGDVMLGTDHPDDRLPADDGRGQLARVRDLLRDADITFGNLEGALADGLPPVKVCQDMSVCYLV